MTDNIINIKSEDMLEAFRKIFIEILNFSGAIDAISKVCESVLAELNRLNIGCKIIILYQYDEEGKCLKIMSLSQVKGHENTASDVNNIFDDLVIPETATDNFCIKTFLEKKPYDTYDWKDILTPSLSADTAKKIQNIAGIKTTIMIPVVTEGKSAGLVLFGFDKVSDKISDSDKEIISVLASFFGIIVFIIKLNIKNEKTSAKLDKANIDIQELAKLKDEFVSLASHELRTPMAAIKGSLSTILEGYAGDISIQAREFLVAAANENERLLRLVNNLLNISKIEAGRFNFELACVRYDDLIKEVVTNLESSAKEKGLFLMHEEAENLPTVIADDDKLKEVLINIIGNAIKFTHKGGVIIRTKIVDDFVMTTITDTGSGIAADDQEVLFKKFSQARSNYAKTTGGTGLGLYICKQIIEGMKGKIWLESTLGVGSTFFFTLPIEKK